jgi:hypothetical protein
MNGKRTVEEFVKGDFNVEITWDKGCIRMVCTSVSFF